MKRNYFAFKCLKVAIGILFLVVLKFNVNGKTKFLNLSEFKISEEKQEVPSLLVSLVKDAVCYNTATGQIKLIATNFPVGYKLQYAVALASSVEQYLYPLEDISFTNALKWQVSNIFDVKSGVWIGYIKATNISDPNNILYVGHSTDKNGNRILAHRVFVNQPTQVQGYVWDKYTVPCLCYGQNSGKIKVSGISGGSGPAYSAHIYGVSFEGIPFDLWYSNVQAGSILDGLYASNNIKDTINAVNSYKIEFYDNQGCVSPVYFIAAIQPKKIVFNFDFSFKSCSQSINELWISSIDASTGSGAISSWKWHYTTDPTWATNVSPWYTLTTKVTNLPAGNYYIEVQDGNGCIAVANSLAKLVGNSNIVFEVGHTDSNLGPGTGQLKILSYDPRTGNGNEGLWKWHYTTDPTWNTKVSPWYGLWTSATQLPVGKYYVQVKDALGCTSAVSQVTIDNLSSATPVIKLAHSSYKVVMPSDNLTLFEFVSPESVNARIDIYDISGRRVQTIFNNPIEGGITYQAEFKTESKMNGIYIYRITIGNKIHNGKLVL